MIFFFRISWNLIRRGWKLWTRNNTNVSPVLDGSLPLDISKRGKQPKYERRESSLDKSAMCIQLDFRS